MLKNKNPTFAKARMPQLKEFVKKYNRSVFKENRIVLTDLTKKKLVDAINDKMLNNSSSPELQEEYNKLAGKIKIPIETKPIEEKPKPKPKPIEEKPKPKPKPIEPKPPSNDMALILKQLEELRKNEEKREKEMSELKLELQKMKSILPMPSIQDMKSLYTKKQLETPQPQPVPKDSHLMPDGSVMKNKDMPKKEKKTIRISSKTLEPKKEKKKKGKTITIEDNIIKEASDNYKIMLPFSSDDVIKLIEKARPTLKEKTVTAYVYLLNILYTEAENKNSNFTNLDWLFAQSDIEKSISKFPILRQRDILNAIIVILKSIPENVRTKFVIPKVIAQYSHTRDDINLKYYKESGNTQQVEFWTKRKAEQHKGTTTKPTPSLLQKLREQQKGT